MEAMLKGSLLPFPPETDPVLFVLFIEDRELEPVLLKKSKGSAPAAGAAFPALPRPVKPVVLAGEAEEAAAEFQSPARGSGLLPTAVPD